MIYNFKNDTLFFNRYLVQPFQGFGASFIHNPRILFGAIHVKSFQD